MALAVPTVGFRKTPPADLAVVVVVEEATSYRGGRRLCCIAAASVVCVRRGMIAGRVCAAADHHSPLEELAEA